MSAPPLSVLAVAGSLNRNSATRAVINLIAQQLTAAGARVDVLDMADEQMAIFNPDSSHAHESSARQTTTAA
jgi:NAD(P)H-dependent FMN reductase